MLPPLLKIMINEPELLAEHIEAYTHLFVKDMALWQTSIKRQWKWKLTLGLSMVLFLLFAGVSVMLWGITQRSHWSLWVIPLTPLVTGIVASLMLSSKNALRTPFGALKNQFCSDIRMLKGAK